MGAVEHMTPEQARAFLRAGTRTAKLATASRDGQPHVVPVWFVFDGEDLVFTTHETSVKGRALRRERRVSLCVDDETPPYAFVTVQGVAAIDTDLAALRRWATAIGRRYMGADRAEEFGARNGVPGELLVRVTPTKIIGRDAMAA
jgi:PPOX class probable F420-dependent enzyme